jgi:hypothetical protein
VTAADHRLLSTGVLFGQQRSYDTLAVGVPRASAGLLQRGPAVVGGVGVVQRRHATAKNRRKMQKASEFFCALSALSAAALTCMPMSGQSCALIGLPCTHARLLT